MGGVYHAFEQRQNNIPFRKAIASLKETNLKCPQFVLREIVWDLFCYFLFGLPQARIFEGNHSRQIESDMFLGILKSLLFAKPHNISTKPKNKKVLVEMSWHAQNLYLGILMMMIIVIICFVVSIFSDLAFLLVDGSHQLQPSDAKTLPDFLYLLQA